MTATPRLYTDDAKSRAACHDISYLIVMEKTVNFEELVTMAQEKHEAAKSRLCALLDEVNAEQMLSIMVTHLLVRPFTGDDEFGHHPVLVENLAYLLFSKADPLKGRDVTPIDTAECQELLEVFWNSSRVIHIHKDMKEHYHSLPDEVRVDSEIVRGDAYIHQTTEKINQIQGKFDKWFERKIGICPTRAIKILYSIGEHIEEIFNEKVLPEAKKYCAEQAERWSPLKKEIEAIIDGKLISISCKRKQDAEIFFSMDKYNQIVSEMIPVDIKFINLSPPVNESEEKGLKEILAISKKTFSNKIHNLRDIRKYPLYEFHDGRIVLSYFSNTLDMLWEAFDGIAKSDNEFFDRYQKYKSKWTEEKVIECLKRIFPDSTIFHTLDYPDIEKGDKSTAELDMAILYEPFLVIIEVKAKQFKMKSKYGDTSSLRFDIKANIEDAYMQSLRAIKYINKSEVAVFTERKSGRKLTVTKDEIYKIYPVSVSLHRLATIATALKRTQEIDLFKEKSYPFATCLSDLDTITSVKITPEVFLHYIERRLKEENKEYYYGDELDLFGFYLETRLHRNNYSPNGKKLAGLFLAGFDESFNKFMHKKQRSIVGDDIDLPEIKLNIPVEINKLINKLKKTDNRDGRLIAFSLLELDNNFLNSIATYIEKLKGDNIPDSIVRRVSFSSDEIAVSIVASNAFSADRLPEKIYQRVILEKYRRKVNKSIGIGMVCENGRLVLKSACYAESLWEHDADMDYLIENDSPFVPSSGVKFPGVNQPCICGSGKKFKKCCKRKIEDNRRKFPFKE
jgi:hypothetical protein